MSTETREGDGMIRPADQSVELATEIILLVFPFFQ